jgi:hypothetical protein
MAITFTVNWRREREDHMSGDTNGSQSQSLPLEAGSQRRRDGPPVTGVGITVQVIGLDPQDVRVVERRVKGEQWAVFIELGGNDCKVTLAGRLKRLQQVTAEMAQQLAQLEEARRAGAE